MTRYGECVVERHYGLTAAGVTARPVVRTADRLILMSRELLEGADAEFLRRSGDDLTFGTPGEGLGEVTYRIVGEDFPADAVVLERIA